jgi:hypothetical protein
MLFWGGPLKSRTTAALQVPTRKVTLSGTHSDVETDAHGLGLSKKTTREACKKSDCPVAPADTFRL